MESSSATREIMTSDDAFRRFEEVGTDAETMAEAHTAFLAGAVEHWELRLVEAEAILTETPTDWMEAMTIINEVRTRNVSDDDGMPLHPWVATDAGEAWTQLRRERGIELWLEGPRLSDMRRWEGVGRARGDARHRGRVEPGHVSRPRSRALRADGAERARDQPKSLAVRRPFRRAALAALALTLGLPPGVGAQEVDPHTYEGTYSIIGRDPDTGELGMGVQSRAFAVGYRTWTATGGLAIWAHQASSNPYYGRVGMEMLAAGLAPEEVLDRLRRSDVDSDRRQVAVLHMDGRTAAFTGGATSDWKGHHCGVDYCAQGNTLAGPEVVQAMAESFESSPGIPLADRLLDALDAAEAAGGDRRGRQAAAMTVVRAAAGAGGYSDIVLDIRVNDHPLPLVEIRRLLTVFRSPTVIAEAHERFDAGAREDALAALLDLRDRIPMKDAVWIGLAHMYLKMERRDDALEALEEAMRLNPRNANYLPTDDDFAELHDDPEFQRIVGGG